jgi:uncharacterized protein involved in exopolysaccharide biosynthesis
MKALLRVAPALLALALAAGHASAQPRTVPGQAQKDAVIRPPTPTDQPGPPSFVNMLALALIVGACVGAAIIPSKRGHQD